MAAVPRAVRCVTAQGREIGTCQIAPEDGVYKTRALRDVLAPSMDPIDRAQIEIYVAGEERLRVTNAILPDGVDDFICEPPAMSATKRRKGDDGHPVIPGVFCEMNAGQHLEVVRSEIDWLGESEKECHREGAALDEADQHRSRRLDLLGVTPWMQANLYGIAKYLVSEENIAGRQQYVSFNRHRWHFVEVLRRVELGLDRVIAEMDGIKAGPIKFNSHACFFVVSKMLLYQGCIDSRTEITPMFPRWEAKVMNDLCEVAAKADGCDHSHQIRIQFSKIKAAFWQDIEVAKEGPKESKKRKDAGKKRRPDDDDAAAVPAASAHHAAPAAGVRRPRFEKSI